MLNVYTSNISYSGEYRLDISVKSCTDDGSIFIPTWKMVTEYKAGNITQAEYTDQYYNLMRNSYNRYKQQWDHLLCQDKVVLVCYCKSYEFCHRRLLAAILIKLGATYKGEINYF